MNAKNGAPLNGVLKEEAKHDAELDELAASIGGPVEDSAAPLDDEFDGPVKVIDRGKVTQSSLRYYLRKKRELKDAEAVVKAQKAELKKLEKEFTDATEKGLVPASGGDNLRLEIKTSSKAYPRWKDQAVNLAKQLNMDVDLYVEEVQNASLRPVTTVKVY